MTTKVPPVVIAVSRFLSIRSEKIPPKGEANRKGSIEAKVNKPTKPELSDSASTYHWLAIRKVHVLAPPSALAAQVNL